MKRTPYTISERPDRFPAVHFQKGGQKDRNEKGIRSYADTSGADSCYFIARKKPSSANTASAIQNR